MKNFFIVFFIAQNIFSMDIEEREQISSDIRIACHWCSANRKRNPEIMIGAFVCQICKRYACNTCTAPPFERSNFCLVCQKKCCCLISCVRENTDKHRCCAVRIGQHWRGVQNQDKASKKTTNYECPPNSLSASTRCLPVIFIDLTAKTALSNNIEDVPEGCNFPHFFGVIEPRVSSHTHSEEQKESYEQEAREQFLPPSPEFLPRHIQTNTQPKEFSLLFCPDASVIKPGPPSRAYSYEQKESYKELLNKSYQRSFREGDYEWSDFLAELLERSQRDGNESHELYPSKPPDVKRL